LDPAPLRSRDHEIPSHRRGRPRSRHEPDARGRVLGRQHRREPALREGALQALTPLGKWWTSQCTANAARDEELVELAARSGCKALFLGFESISQESLAATNKGHNRVDDYRRLIAMLHRHGIAVHLGIMFGFDQDDRGIFRRT